MSILGLFHLYITHQLLATPLQIYEIYNWYYHIKTGFTSEQQWTVSNSHPVSSDTENRKHRHILPRKTVQWPQRLHYGPLL